MQVYQLLTLVVNEAPMTATGKQGIIVRKQNWLSIKQIKTKKEDENSKNLNKHKRIYLGIPEITNFQPRSRASVQ